MAFPLAAIPMVGTLGSKLGAALKALNIGKTVAAGTNAAKYAAKVPGATKQLSLNLGKDGAKRMAGDALTKSKNIQFLKDNYGVDVSGTVKDVMNRASGINPTAGLNMADDAGIVDRVRRGLTSTEGFAKNLGVPMSKDELLMTVAPDLMFGGLAMATTEGDLGDKLLAGAGSAVGGVAGGLGARGVLGPKSGLGILATEMGGGIAGDMVGMGVADSLIRAKNGGMTPAEQKYAQQDQAYQQQIIDDFLAQNGLA